MELQFLSFPFFFMSLSFILFMSLFLLKATTPAVNLPPGPWKLPLIGSIHHLVGSLPQQRLKELSQKYGPLMHLKLGERSTIVVSSPKVAKQVLKTHDTIFAQRPQFLGADIALYGSIDLGFSPYGHYWRQLRKICVQELLSLKRVRSFQSIREAEVSNLIRNISAKTGTCINLGEKIDSMTYAIIARAAFGAKCKDQEEFISVVEEIMVAAGEFSVTDLFPSQKWLHVITGERHRFKEMHRKADVILENIISSAASENEGEAEGLVSVLLRLMKDHGSHEFPLTTSNIKAVLLDMFIAGTETSSTVAEWAIYEMLKDPQVLTRAQAEVRHVFGSKDDVGETALHELEYLKSVIKETMRLHPPLPLLPRVSSESCEINGYTISKGTHVLVNAWAIGRDTTYWKEAEKFCPERFLDCPIDYKGSNFEFIPFGAGKRICPGMLFGAVNIELAVAQLLYYFDWELPIGTDHENLDITEAFGNSLRRKKDLFVVPISYNHVPLE